MYSLLSLILYAPLVGENSHVLVRLVILYHTHSHRNPSTGGWRAVKLVEGTLCPPTKEGWGDGTYVVVLSTAKPSSDANGSETETSVSYSISNAPSVGEFIRTSQFCCLHTEGAVYIPKEIS